MRSRDLTFQAMRLQELLRKQGDYGHLNVEVQDAGERWIVARATPIGAVEYGLSFRTHTGRWEPMPVSGLLEEIVKGLVGCLGPYLDPRNLR